MTLRLHTSALAKMIELVSQEEFSDRMEFSPAEHTEVYTMLRFHLHYVLHKELRLSRYI
jgi:hypothetical protein